MRNVRVGAKYVYIPVLLDITDGRTNLKKGDLVQVINLPGCPKANTMGHCYVGDVKGGKFIGMVCTNSLIPVKEYKATKTRLEKLVSDLTLRLTTCDLSDFNGVKATLTDAQQQLAAIAPEVK